ncbi:MAG TPA: hypothetical protein PKN75_00535 [Bacteroidia bacterium]|nr:hypothetical protein [Bacteroidia bacterium]HNU32058.1 hypothetical protein [Bacteroidia bacterium]
MAEQQFITLQKFNSIGLAQELAELLKENCIEYVLDGNEHYNNALSIDRIGEYRIKLRESDFETANELLLDISQKQLQNIDKDYYLFEFSNEELLEVITKPDEWGQLDNLLAQKLLKERGMEVNPALVETLNKQRIHEISKTEQGNRIWIYAGYFFALVGGALSIFIGWHLISYKKILPNNDTIYGFSEADRKHGKRILILGIIFTIIWVIAQLKIAFFEEHYS